MGEFEQAVKITAKLYRIRDAAKFLLGDEYAEKMAEWRDGIEKVAKARNVTDLAAAALLGQKAMEQGGELTFIKIMAAYVEMSEPSIETTKGVATA